MSPRAWLNAVAVVVSIIAITAAGAADQKAGARPTDNPATWKAEVRSQYDAIRKLPANAKQQVLVEIRKLSAHGPDARPAIDALAADGALPEPHRAYAGIMAAAYSTWDVPALRAMVETHKNPFARREAVERLVDIGGPANKAFLEAQAKKDATLAAYIAKAVARAPAAEAVAEQDRKLLSTILNEPPDGKKTATVVLVDRHQGKATVDAQLERLATLSVADGDAQVYAAIALSRIHADSVPALKALTARNKHRYIRYNAMQQLAKTGPGGVAVLKELLAAPDEPLKPQIEKFLSSK